MLEHESFDALVDRDHQPAAASAFFLFGKLSARAKGCSVRLEGRKVQELLSYLLLFEDRPHHREVLSEALWGATSLQPRKYLRHALWQLQSLRQQGATSLLLVGPEWIQINPQASVWTDVSEVTETFALVKGTKGEDLDLVQAGAVKRAVDLYVGDLLEGWYGDWCVYERERLRTIYLAMLDKLLCRCEAQGEPDEGVTYGERILRQDRAHERTHRRLMSLHYRAGDRTSAMRQFEACRAALVEELGVQPAEPTVRLYEQIRADTMIEHGHGGRAGRSLRELTRKTEDIQPSGRHGSGLREILEKLGETLSQVEIMVSDALQIVQDLDDPSETTGAVSG